ncbi:MAG: hypothetical protein DMG57_41775 [Acidobacteria bacterium]|nr:MAG: hypothetical protein DMG57_41775 [Acidobacteriota bacterium]
MPPSLIHAVISAEDKRFFQHSGFDPFRIMKAAWVDFRSGRKEQGASALSMQLARNFCSTRTRVGGASSRRCSSPCDLRRSFLKSRFSKITPTRCTSGAWALSASTGSEQRHRSISGRTSASFQCRRQLSSPRSSSGRATTTPYVVPIVQLSAAIWCWV